MVAHIDCKRMLIWTQYESRDFFSVDYVSPVRIWPCRVSIFWQWANRAHSKFDGKSIRERIYLAVHPIHTYLCFDRQRVRGFHFPGRWKDLERGAASPALRWQALEYVLCFICHAMEPARFWWYFRGFKISTWHCFNRVDRKLRRTNGIQSSSLVWLMFRRPMSRNTAEWLTTNAWKQDIGVESNSLSGVATEISRGPQLKDSITAIVSEQV